MSQLHLAFLKFHNAVLTDVKAAIGATHTLEEVFEETQRIVRWHYQWLVLHEFLPATIGATLAHDIATNGRKFFAWRNDPYIPVEFSVAAYRFGHSQVRPSYRPTSAPARRPRAAVHRAHLRPCGSDAS